MDELNGVTRANFIKEDCNELKDNHLFSDVEIKSQLPHEGNYVDLERVAKLTRAELELGINTLSSLVDTIYGSDYERNNKPKDIEQDLAKFALVAIQMIEQATHFKYIEEEVRDLGLEHRTFVPDAIFISLQNDLGMISELIYSSVDKTDCVTPVKVPGYPWDDIKPKMGLLKYKDLPSRLDDVPASLWRVFSAAMIVP
ncbi:ribosome-inactivating protein lychnin-like [Silene latifolia]|uniref:ribosome-inactivating protein lychnin-like n=1 Tax=Silene latifolia TaxID=37657 RepID=UPI003D771C2F